MSARRDQPDGPACTAGEDAVAHCDSGNATAPSPAFAPGAERIDTAAFAASYRADPRLARHVPGFDAPFFQAGLAGYSDAAMRLIARRHGAPFCVTEALLDRTLLAGGRGFAKADLGELEDNIPGGADDHPLAGQIMGSDPDTMAAAAIKMIEPGRRPPSYYRALTGRPPELFTASLPRRDRAAKPLATGGHPESGSSPPPLSRRESPGGVSSHPVPPWEKVAAQRQVEGIDSSSRTFAVIDVNLACPVKKISKMSRGGHWLREPEGAIDILRAVRAAVPRPIATAVKLRRGWDDSPDAERNFFRIFEAAYDLGYAFAVVHGRTVEQKYQGPSRWTFLRDLVRRYPDRLILGSGDVWDAHEIFRMIAYTGVHAASVARGCIGNPWVFRQARDLMAGLPPRPPTLAEQRGVLLEHFDLSARVNGEHKAGKMMRKFGIRFAAHHPDGDAVRRGFIAVDNEDDWRAVIDRHYRLDGAAPKPAAQAVRA